MTPTQVLAEGMKLLLKQEALQQGRMNRAKPKARPCNKPFDAEERQYLCGLDAVDECGEKRITWNRYYNILDRLDRPWQGKRTASLSGRDFW